MLDIQERGVDDAQRDMERTADEMQEHGDRVDEQADEARQSWDRVQGDNLIPTASTDWDDEDEEPAELGEDPAGFDDPESVDVDEDDDEHADDA